MFSTLHISCILHGLELSLSKSLHQAWWVSQFWLVARVLSPSKNLLLIIDCKTLKLHWVSRFSLGKKKCDGTFWSEDSEVKLYSSCQTLSIYFYVNCLFWNLKHCNLKAKRNHILQAKAQSSAYKQSVAAESNSNGKQIQIFQFRKH